MVPLAPVRLSTLTVWPMRTASFSANSRASASVSPPGGKDTTMVTGLAGQAWASAGLVITLLLSVAAEAASRVNMRRFRGVVRLSSGGRVGAG